MVELPPVLGSFCRKPVVILVTGRTAVARIGGMTAIGRHVATARRLGLDPLVLYPAAMRALGAEITGELEEGTPCLPSDSFDAQAGPDQALVLVIAGDWYIAPRAIMQFSEADGRTAVARFRDRGRTVAPLARMRVEAIKSLIPKLADHPAGELISEAAGQRAELFSLDLSHRHRLSDNVAAGRAEDKLFAAVLGPRESWATRIVQRHLALPITRRLAHTRITPFEVSAAKICLGLVAAYLLTGSTYTAGLAGAAAFFLARVLDGVSGELARAAVRDSSRGEKIDFAGDVLVQLAVLWALALHTPHGGVLATLATVGLLISTTLVYRRLFRALWQARAHSEQYRVPPGNFAARFANRNGAAYGLALTAVVGRLDLFLWAAALASHLYYILWLRSEGGRSA